MKIPKWFKKKRFVVPALIILIVTLIIIVNNINSSSDGEIKGEEIAKVEVLEIAKQNSFTTEVNLKGTIFPREFVRLRGFVGADVQYLAPIGSSVRKGEVIARLTDNRVEDSYYNSLQALSDSQSNLQQTQALNTEAVIQAELGVNSADASMNLAQENFISAKQLSEQDIKSSQNSAEVTYQASYNLIEQVLRFWSNGTLISFVLKGAIVANFELHQLTNDEFDYVVVDFNSLVEVDGENLVLSLSLMEPVLERTKEFNDLIYRVMNYIVPSNYFTQLDLNVLKAQSVIFTAQLNAQNIALKSSLIALETVQVTSQRSLDIAENQLAQAQIQYDNSLAALESAKRQADIRELGARSQVTGNRSQFVAAQGQFEELALLAPFNGVIIAHSVSEGNQVSIGEPIIEMGDISGVEIVLAVDERSGGLIQVGQEVLINNKVVGIIEEISPAASLETGKIQFTVVAGEADELIPGDIAEVNVELIYTLPDVIILPLSYITFSQSETYVLVAFDGQVTKRVIKLAQVHDSHVEVSEGLEEGDQVIITNGDFLNIGQEVEIK